MYILCMFGLYSRDASNYFNEKAYVLTPNLNLAAANALN